MKIDIICCVLQLHIWEKLCSKYIGQNALSQSDGKIYKWTISLEHVNETVWFLHADTKSQKLKLDQ